MTTSEQGNSLSRWNVHPIKGSEKREGKRTEIADSIADAFEYEHGGSDDGKVRYVLDNHVGRPFGSSPGTQRVVRSTIFPKGVE